MKNLNKYEKIYENACNNIDWTELHKQMVLNDQGYKLWVYETGVIAFLTSGTIPNPANEQPVLIINTTGIESEDYYLEGWGTWDEETETFTDDDGNTYTLEEAVIEAIESGDWTDWIDQMKEEIKEDCRLQEEADEYNRLDGEANEDYRKSLEAEGREKYPEAWG